jgi:AraC family transcriptional regulator
MAFRPSMTAFVEGIRPVAALRCRAWPGVVADLWEAQGEPGGRGHYLSPDPHVTIVLGGGAAPLGLSGRPDGPLTGRLAFVPAGVPVWSRVADPRPFRHLDLHFEGAALARRLASHGSRAGGALVLSEGHDEIERLAALLAEEVAAPHRGDFLADALAQAILALILALPEREAAPDAPVRPVGEGLAPAQVARALRLMRSELHRPLPVAEVAAAVGLSEAWFARAFRASTGETPARALARLRVEAAQRLLRDGSSIGEVATATGFADQSHLTRTFGRLTGTTPAAWRRACA